MTSLFAGFGAVVSAWFIGNALRVPVPSIKVAARCPGCNGETVSLLDNGAEACLQCQGVLAYVLAEIAVESQS